MSQDQTTRLFDPALMPARDEDGYAYHPHLDKFMIGEEHEEQRLDIDALKAAGFVATWWGLDADHDEGDPEFDQYWLDSQGPTLWQPGEPEGEGWQLVAVYDTEEGPYALFVRPTAVQP